MRSEHHPQYHGPRLDEGQLDVTPFPLFQRWMDEAHRVDSEHWNAVTLATVDRSGQPSARVVLLKQWTEEGLVFFTNYRSRKATALEFEPRAALLFFWSVLHRQIRIEGITSRVSPEDSNEYFQSRPRESQIAAVASAQSEVIEGRDALVARVSVLRSHYDGQAVDRPSSWGGFRVTPSSFEFWQGQPDRLHDRIRYRLEGPSVWVKERLAP